MPAKIKNFMWRAFSDCLPTLTKLREKRVELDVLCPSCRLEPECVNHCLVFCLFAKSCWERIIPGVDCSSGNSFKIWYESVLTNKREKADLVAAVCWGIWKARNRTVWNNKLMRAESVVAMAIAYLAQWRDAQFKGSSIPLVPVAGTGDGERWSKPEITCVKINCDASYCSESSKGGMGWIARNSNGHLFAAKAMQVKGISEVRSLEALGI